MNPSRDVSVNELRAMVDHTKIALVCMIGRIGILSFSVFLEHRYFEPGTEMNKHFQLAIVDWQEMKWFVIILHKMHLEKVDRLAALLGLRRADGIPMVLHAGGVAKFPLEGPNVWTMEKRCRAFLLRQQPGIRAQGARV